MITIIVCTGVPHGFSRQLNCAGQNHQIHTPTSAGKVLTSRSYQSSAFFWLLAVFHAEQAPVTSVFTKVGRVSQIWTRRASAWLRPQDKQTSSGGCFCDACTTTLTGPLTAWRRNGKASIHHSRLCRSWSRQTRAFWSRKNHLICRRPSAFASTQLWQSCFCFCSSNKRRRSI